MLLASRNGEHRLSSWLDLGPGFGDGVPQLRAVLLASTGAPAAQGLAQAIWGSGLPIVVHSVTLATLKRHAKLVSEGAALPVGDRGLTLKSLEYAKLARPTWSVYPQALLPHMQHMPRLLTASAALRWRKPIFTRPALGGDFKGFINRDDPDLMSSEDRASLEKLLSLSRASPVWVCAPLEIVGIWRYYVLDGELLGYGRVHGNHAHEPESEEVSAIIAAAPHDTPYIVDMAVLRDGSTTLLRTRDVLDMGYPVVTGRSIPSPLDHLRMAWSRWTQLYVSARARGAEGEQRGPQP